MAAPGGVMTDLAALPEVRRVTTAAEREAGLAIRRTVFVDGQGVSPEADLDGLDDVARHALATLAAIPVGTLRWRWYAPGTAKVERVAVLPGHRRLGIGRALVAWALRDIAAEGAAAAMLHAQTDAIGLYRAFGFVEDGLPFVEEGLRHVAMRLALRKA